MFNVAQVLGRGLTRWLELVGQNPSIARDQGLCAWQYLQACEARRAEDDAGRAAVTAGEPARPPVISTTAAPLASGVVQHSDDPYMPTGLAH